MCNEMIEDRRNIVSHSRGSLSIYKQPVSYWLSRPKNVQCSCGSYSNVGRIIPRYEIIIIIIIMKNLTTSPVPQY